MKEADNIAISMYLEKFFSNRDSMNSNSI